MRVAVVSGGVVVSVIDFAEDRELSADALTATGVATYSIEHPEGASEPIAYEVVFHAPEGMTLAVAGEAQAGWIETNEGLAPPPPEMPSESALLAYAARRRWEVETGGLLLSGISVATDDRSKLMIAGARMRAEAHPDVVEMWNGETPITAAQVIAISDAVSAHVSNCFHVFAALKAGIVDGSITLFEEVDSAYQGGLIHGDGNYPRSFK